MESAVVRQMVEQYREQTAYGGSEEHCFAPWYLHQSFQLSEIQAEQQSSDGNYDFGVDGFHLAAADDSVTLVLVQTKYSESVQLIIKGFRDFKRVLAEIRRSLDGVETEEPIQNKVIVNLRAALNRLDPGMRQKLQIDFRVVHLSSEDETILAFKLREACRELKEALDDLLPDRTCTVKWIGPRELGPTRIVHVPPVEVPLPLLGAYEFTAGIDGGKMFCGVGRLADLVELYRARRDDLFSRNVRYYLKKKTNTEKGPAGRMRATLKNICVETAIEPERFALFHNGVTLLASVARQDGDSIVLREPYVLNGCQTIKSAFLFRHEPHLKNRIKEEAWQRISIPVRIIVTRDAELVRTVTVNNNRQNAMSPAALHANDEVQLRLEQRFKARRIVYQRQEGAFDNVWDVHPEWLDDQYENTRGTFVDIVDLARSLAATAGELHAALHPNDLFENDTAYDRCFDEDKRLRSVVLMTFLQNVHDTIGLVLKKDLELSPGPGAPKPSRLVYHAMCLLMRHLARERMSDFVVQWGSQLYPRDADFREAIRKILNSQRSRIRSELARGFMNLESGDGTTLSEAFAAVERALLLGPSVDPFAIFGELDNTLPDLQGRHDSEGGNKRANGDRDTGSGANRGTEDAANRRFRDEMLGTERGLTVSEIARMLGYEESTVRSYLSSPQRTHDMGDRIRSGERLRNRALAIVARRRGDD